ncbi:MAG: hypothetical protein Kow0091_30010 [Geminocystis sp.]
MITSKALLASGVIVKFTLDLGLLKPVVALVFLLAIVILFLKYIIMIFYYSDYGIIDYNFSGNNAIKLYIYNCDNTCR